jgi:lysophospholipase L1-like esterase
MRAVVTRLLGSVFVFALTLGLAEAAIRLLPVGGPSFRSTVVASVSSPVSRAYRFKVRSFKAAKDPDIYRVLALGDSFTWGGGVLEGDAYPERLERLLKRWRPEQHFQVLNAGRRGFNTVDELNALHRDSLLERFKPDLLILGYCLNDPEPTSRHARDLLKRPLHRRVPDAGGKGWLYARSALYHFVYDRLENTRQRRATTSMYRQIFDPGGQDWQQAVAALAAIRDLAAARSVPLVVVVFPVFDSQMDDRYPYAAMHQQLVRTGRDLGVEMLDMLPDFRGIDGRRLAVEPFTDPHPSELAHRIIAQRLFEYVKQRLEAGGAEPQLPQGTRPAPARG